MFAPEALALPDNKVRRIVWAWCMDERPQPIRVASGWSGVITLLPRVLSLDTNGILQIEPVEELKTTSDTTPALTTISPSTPMGNYH